MNICVVSVGQLNPLSGGIERVSDNLIRQFKAEGHKIIGVFLNKGNPNISSSYQQFQLPESNDILNTINQDFLHELLIEFNIDIILNQAFYYAMFELCVNAKQNTKAKLVSTLHTAPDCSLKELIDKYDYIRIINNSKLLIKFKQIIHRFKYPVSFYLRKKHLSKRYKRIYEESDAYILLSDSQLKQFSSIAKLKNTHKLFAINNPIIIQHFDNNSNRKNQLLFVGKMNFQKRADRILDIWKELYADYHDWDLILLGDGDAMLQMKTYAKKLQLENIYFEGNINPEPYYINSKILCMTSTHEGFGMVLAEAQQHGCVPIVYNSFNSLKDIIDDGENGFRIPPFKKKIYIQRLRQLMDNKSLREKMSLMAKQTCKKFDVKVIAQEWLNLFTSLTKNM